MVSRVQSDSSSHGYYSWTAPMWTPLRTNSRLGLTKFHHFKWISMVINQGVFNSGVSFTKGSTIVDVACVWPCPAGPCGPHWRGATLPYQYVHGHWHTWEQSSQTEGWDKTVTIMCDIYETRKQWKVYTCCKVLIIWGKWYQYQSCLLVYMYMQEHWSGNIQCMFLITTV